ncbi:hypothetical protein FHR70_001111 [Microvirga lupini]|uniref:YbgF trimerisation domain-containing protein n=1 Tax=Microvirga lupini TaxID=420324 RepID=A0A7W4VIZ5_9HYPH|nr:hypothetical protein [Microvirga lupini]MBB3018071.1 hypothetical protein [Microvirga lupini]
MRIMMALAVGSSLILPLAVPADAQTRLPRVSPSERAAKDINRRIREDQKLLNLEERIQMDNNQIRQDIQRERLFAPRALPPVSRGACPRGSISC